jgi:hypothetical protein
MKSAVLAILIGLCAACSNQAAMAPTPSIVAKPPAAVPTTPGAATPPGPSSVPTTTASGSTLTPATSGVTVLNQYDPPVPIQVNR